MRRWFHSGDCKISQGLILLIILMTWWLSPAPDAFAKRQITVTAVSMPTDVVMLTPSTSVSISVTNNNTGADKTANVNTVQFSLLAGYTWNIGAISPPTGWTVSVSGGKLTFTTTSTLYMIAWPNSLTFNLVLGAIPQGTQDVLNESWLPKVAANYDQGSPPANNNSPGITWNRRSFLMTLVASPTSVSASAPNNIITLTMTVTNRSSAAWSGIVSSPNPPTMTTTASGFTITLTSGPTPASLTLASNQTSTITWTYTVALASGKTCPTATPGTVTFTAQARNGAGTATSGAAITSNAVSVGCFTASISIPTCGGAGSAISVVMTVYNFNSSAMNSLRNATIARDPSSTNPDPPVCGAPSYSSFTAPANSSSTTITWSCTLPSTATPGQTYVFQGQVTGTLQSDGKTYTTPPALSNTLAFSGGAITAIPNPTMVSAGGSNVIITWTVTNGGCGAQPIKNVQISVPSGWIYGLSSSMVNGIDDWTDTPSGSPTNLVTYAAGTPMPLGASGDFTIIFSQAPVPATTPTSYSFNVHVTDVTNAAVDIPTTVTVGPAAIGGSTKPDPVQEIIPP